MKPVDQTVFGSPNGDCFRACVASILELPIEEVPNWAAENRGIVRRAMEWLRARGHACLNIQWEPVAYDHKQYLSTGMERVHCILGGVSPRSTPEARLYHAVVGHAAGWSFEIDHDPHPSRAGIVGEPIDAVWIFRGTETLKHLGPLDGAIAEPIVPCPEHPFALVEGNHFCGMCGGGILHPIHERNVSVQQKRP